MPRNSCDACGVEFNDKVCPICLTPVGWTPPKDLGKLTSMQVHVETLEQLVRLKRKYDVRNVEDIIIKLLKEGKTTPPSGTI